ncbi:MAG: Nif3-like dinuclear metal center hexameric protein [Haloarculaceae archaeon]
MDLTTICDRFGDRLALDDYADVDASANGLQVGPDEASVETVAFAVDAVEATIEAAADRGADLLVTHHGISWGGIDRVTGSHYRRVSRLVENDLALYAVHLPLDGHPELGNAAGLADLLDVVDPQPFGELGPVTIGQRGELDESFERGELARYLMEHLDTGGRPVPVLDFGPETVEDVAIVTGAGADWFDEAAAAGVDAFVVGEGKHRVYHEAREAGVNVYLAGHYATETFGVRALRDLADEWGLETAFVEHPTGL